MAEKLDGMHWHKSVQAMDHSCWSAKPTASVGTQWLTLAVEAADRLAELNIQAEVIDLRSLSPVDWDTCADSLQKTHRLMVVEEDCRFAGAGAEIIATLTERCFFELDAVPVRVAALDMPTPFNADLEATSIPRIEDIVRAAQTLTGRQNV